jgi:predicted ATPase
VEEVASSNLAGPTPFFVAFQKPFSEYLSGMSPPFIRQITVRNYKSIAACKLNLPRLAFIVGPNGSGKSNLLDCFRFVSDSLKTSLDHALRDRGTIKEVRRRSGGHPNHFSLRLDFDLPPQDYGHLSFRVGAKQNGGFEVQNEECQLFSHADPSMEHFYHVQGGVVTDASFDFRPAAVNDRLFLVAASGLPTFRPIFDALSRMEVYNLNPKEIAAMQKPDPGELLRRDGGNLASVFHGLPEDSQKHINSYLARVVRGISEAETATLGSQETLKFKQSVKGQNHPWSFLASSMSDGTLRAFGILVAIFQAMRTGDKYPLLVGLEEPEMALHPGAAGILLGALREASQSSQILVTSHSPDLLDDSDLDVESLFAVDNENGVTRIGTIDEAGNDVLRKKLFTAGELLRQNQLAPDKNSLTDETDERQMKLFELNGA